MYSQQDFITDTHVSRETLSHYKIWEKLLSHWNKSINLVQKSSVEHFWQRHALDSQQLIAHIPKSVTQCLDMGSGAGFPGLAIAIEMKQRGEGHVDLVESNGKKCTFLRTVIRELGLPATVKQERAESLTPQMYDVISARAFAPMPNLLAYSLPFWGAGTIGLFPKGQAYLREIEDAQPDYAFDYETFESQSDAEGKIIVVKKLISKTQSVDAG